MEEKSNEWKFGVSLASIILVFGSAPFMYFLFPGLLDGTATEKEVDLWWRGYLILWHLAFLLQLKVTRTIFKRKIYVFINDVFMAIILNDVIDRVFGVEYIRWYDFLGVGIITFLFIVKHYNFMKSWLERVRKF